MQNPPNFSQPPARKSRTGLWVGVILGVLALCCVLPIAVIGIIAVPAVKSTFSMVGCTMYASGTRDALVSYAKANKDTLPAAEGWQDKIKSQLEDAKKKLGDFEGSPMKPSDLLGDACDAEAGTSLTLNAEFAGKKLSSIKDVDAILLFETPGKGRNKAAKYTPQDQNNAPKVMRGAPRGWLVISVSGDPDLIGPKGTRSRVNARGSSVQFETKSKSSSGGTDSAPESELAKAPEKK